MKGLLKVYMMDYLLKARSSKEFSKKPKEDRKETNKQVKVACKIFNSYVCMEYNKETKLERTPKLDPVSKTCCVL